MTLARPNLVGAALPVIEQCLRASSVLALGVLLMPWPVLATPNQSAGKPRTEIERLVLDGGPAAEGAIRDWIIRHQEQPERVQEQMDASGFRRVPSSRGCLSYVYSGELERTRKDRVASLVICPEKEPVVLLLTTVAPRTDAPTNWPRIQIGPVTPIKNKQ